MVKFEPLGKDAFQRGRGSAKTRKLDLTPYYEMVRGREVGEGGLLTMEPDEQQRTTKRRLTIAAHAQGFGVKWRSAPAGQLRFQLVDLQKSSDGRK